MMRTLGLDVVPVPDPVNYENIRENIGLVARRLGVPDKAAELIAQFDASLDRTKDALKEKELKVLVFGAGGYSAGRPGLFDATLGHVGLVNMAAMGESSGWVPMTVEDVIRIQPDLLILGDYRPDAPSLAGNILVHPALKDLASSLPIVHMPTRLWNCGTPTIAEAAQFLVDAVNQLSQGGGLPR